jgi:glycolate oxidase
VSSAGRPTPELATRLLKLLGRGRAYERDDERALAYGHDESPLPACPPDAVAIVESADEVEAVLALARELHTPIVARGGGTGLTGGAIPRHGGIVLSFEKMTRILEVDGGDLVASVEPGVLLQDFHSTVESQGLFYPPDPASVAIGCTLGGNVAECAGGPRAFKYGVTREYVLGLDVLLADGSRIKTGRRTVKGVVGYDLNGLFVGSEGTLGIVTRMTLRLLPLPPELRTVLCLFDDELAAARGVVAILKKGDRPRCLELMDRPCLDAVRARGAPIPPGTGAAVLVEFDGSTPDGVEATLTAAAEACDAQGCRDLLVAQTEAERAKLWSARRALFPALRAKSPRSVSEDVVVPLAAIPVAVQKVAAIANEHRLECGTFGHMGDGNLHFVFGFEDTPEAVQRCHRALAETYRAVLDLRGTLSGEHGVGLLKSKFLPWEQDEATIALQRKLKRTLDPDNLLNPGKIFPD